MKVAAMSDKEQLRRLAEAVKTGAGELYELDWKPTVRGDNFGICPRIMIGGKYTSAISLGCWSETQAPIIQKLAEYLAMLEPDLILELLDNGRNP